MTIYIKKIVFLTFFSLFASFAFAPNDGFIIIFKNPPIEPFGKLINAIGMVETGNDTHAYNPKEEAVGFLQIRPVRVQDYNKRTGSNYTINDMYSYKISEEIFLYYALKIGPYDLERIARNWNGSGTETLAYWTQVSEYL
jgi:hypothetical protein